MATELRYPKGQAFFDNAGTLLASGTIQWYEAGTTVDQATYSDAAGTLAIPNPATLNSAGRIVDGSSNPVAVYIKDGNQDYKEVIKDSGGSTLYTDDNIPKPVDPTAGLSDFAKPLNEWSVDTAATVNLTTADLGTGRLADTSSNSITYNLPSASSAGNGKSIVIKKTSVSNSVTMDGDTTDQVEGGSTFAWEDNERAFKFTSDGAAWHVESTGMGPIVARNFSNLWCDDAPVEDTTPELDDLMLTQLVAGGKRKVKRSSWMKVAPDIIVEHQETSGTASGGLTSGADRVTTLNTEVRDILAIANLSSNRIQLPAGTYYFEWDRALHAVDRARSWLYDVTGAADLAFGLNVSTSNINSTGGISTGSHIVTIAATNSFEIRARCTTTNGTSGQGFDNSFGTEVYAQVRIWKISE